MGKIRHVSRGERFRPRSEEWNRIADFINQFGSQAGAVGGRMADGPPPPGVVVIRNNTTKHVPRFGVLGIDGSVVRPKFALGEFQNRIAVEGVEPSNAGAARGRFVIMTEPVRPGAIGWGMIRGETICRVNMVDESHLYATVGDGVYDRLVSSGSGAAQLLFVEKPTDRDRPEDNEDPDFVEPDEIQPRAWAIVNLGGVAVGSRFAAVIVCLGPDGEPQPDDNQYWVQDLRVLAGVPGDPAEPTSGTGGIVLATNFGESGTHTHALHVGEVVDCWNQTDDAGSIRLVFNRVP